MISESTQKIGRPRQLYTVCFPPPSLPFRHAIVCSTFLHLPLTVEYGDEPLWCCVWHWLLCCLMMQGPAPREVVPIRRRQHSEDVSLWGSTKSTRQINVDSAGLSDDEEEGEEESGFVPANADAILQKRAPSAAKGNPNRFHSASHTS
jgi:hypothetical protein